MSITEFIQIIAAFIGAFAFALLFNIRGKKLIVAAVGGIVSWALFLVLRRFIENEALCYLIVSISLSVYSEIMARVLKTPTTTFITVSLIPLIPGGSLYYTMASAFEGNMESFVGKGIATLMLAAALALGIIIVSAATKLISALKQG
jgi:uncharacterized membrane protein YjjB (DUF3815 family)